MKLRNLPSRKKEKLCEPLLVSDSNYTSIILATLADDLGSVASAYMASHNSIHTALIPGVLMAYSVLRRHFKYVVQIQAKHSCP